MSSHFTPPESSPSPADTNAFLPILDACEDGVLLAELSDRTRELVHALQQQAAARGSKPRGSLTLKIEFLLDGPNVELRADVTTKEPKAERARTIFWHLRDGGLSANNPKQLVMDLPPREVDTPSAKPRIIA